MHRPEIGPETGKHQGGAPSAADVADAIDAADALIEAAADAISPRWRALAAG